MLDYLVTSRAKRELFRLVWGKDRVGSVSLLAREAGLSFSPTHRELEAMRSAGLVRSERRGAELLYRRVEGHLQTELLRALAAAPPLAPEPPAAKSEPQDDVRGWLQQMGAPLSAPRSKRNPPSSEVALTEALVLSHTDPTVARVLPFVLWRQRADLDLDHLAVLATQRDEAQSLGYFLELAGKLGKDRPLLQASKQLVDRRRRRPRMFFAGRHGRRAVAAASKRTPQVARRWGYLMNAGVDSFKSVFDKSSGS